MNTKLTWHRSETVRGRIFADADGLRYSVDSNSTGYLLRVHTLEEVTPDFYVTGRELIADNHDLQKLAKATAEAFATDAQERGMDWGRRLADAVSCAYENGAVQ